MPYPSDITYPAEATNAAWQKKKSLVDKAGKTGVGPKLTAAEKAWSKIPFTDLDESKNKPKTSGEAKQAWDKAKLAYKQVDAASKVLDEAIDTVKTASKSKTLTSGSKAALANILTKLEAAKKRLGAMYDLPGCFEIDHRNILKEEATAMDELTKVQLKSGATLIAEAKSATKQSGGGYWAKDTKWKPIADHGLKYLQAKVTLTGTGKKGAPFSEEFKIVGVVGDGTTKLK